MSSEESVSGEENEGRLLVVRPPPGDQMNHRGGHDARILHSNT